MASLTRARRWDPPWWGNEEFPPDERFYLMIRCPGLDDAEASQSAAEALIKASKKGAAAIKGAAFKALEPYVRGPFNLVLEGEPVQSLDVLLGYMSVGQLTELQRILVQGVSPDEGNASARPSGD